MLNLIESIKDTFVNQFERSVINRYEQKSLYTKSFCTEIRLHVYHLSWPRNFWIYIFPHRSVSRYQHRFVFPYSKVIIAAFLRFPRQTKPCHVGSPPHFNLKTLRATIKIFCVNAAEKWHDLNPFVCRNFKDCKYYLLACLI